MSELKAFESERIYWAVEQVERVAGDIDSLHLDDNLFYIKSEADKVIANRDYEIKNLKDSIGKLLKAKTEQVITEVMQKALIYGEGFVRVEDAMKLIIELRHHKYKRCLDKAEWCESKVYHIRRTPLCDMSEHEGWQHDDEFWQRWHKRWLELAEKFKECV